MEFLNPTPFEAICFSALNTHNDEFHVVPHTITFNLVPLDGEAGPDGCTHRLVLSPEQQPLALTDAYAAACNQSSVLWESDLAPEKPRCDVIVVGSAHAPGGRPARGFPVGVRVEEPSSPRPEPDPPQGLNPLMGPSAEALQEHQAAVAWAKANPIQGDVLLDATLQVWGPRQFQRSAWPLRWLGMALRVASLNLIRPNPWRLTRPKPFLQLPLGFEEAYGGACRVEALETEVAKRIPPKDRLTPEQQAAHPDRDHPPVAHTACMANPLGKGFAEGWYVKATRYVPVSAPRLEHPDHPLTARDFWRLLRGKKVDPEKTTPRSLGVRAKAWQPRIALAGTYDAAWIKERHPYLPKDFDFAYWNGACLQTPHLLGDEVATLTNLLPWDAPGVAVDGQGNTRARFQLPGYLVGLSLTTSCETPQDVPSVLDTVILDLERSTVRLTWRGTAWKEKNLLGLETFVDPEGRSGDWWKRGQP